VWGEWDQLVLELDEWDGWWATSARPHLEDGGGLADERGHAPGRDELVEARHVEAAERAAAAGPLLARQRRLPLARQPRLRRLEPGTYTRSLHSST